MGVQVLSLFGKWVCFSAMVTLAVVLLAKTMAAMLKARRVYLCHVRLGFLLGLGLGLAYIYYCIFALGGFSMMAKELFLGTETNDYLQQGSNRDNILVEYWIEGVAIIINANIIFFYILFKMVGRCHNIYQRCVIRPRPTIISYSRQLSPCRRFSCRLSCASCSITNEVTMVHSISINAYDPHTIPQDVSFVVVNNPLYSWPTDGARDSVRSFTDRIKGTPLKITQSPTCEVVYV